MNAPIDVFYVYIASFIESEGIETINLMRESAIASVEELPEEPTSQDDPSTQSAVGAPQA